MAANQHLQMADIPQMILLTLQGCESLVVSMARCKLVVVKITRRSGRSSADEPLRWALDYYEINPLLIIVSQTCACGR